MPETVDQILIEKTLTGSLECYDVLMQRYEKDVFAVARGYTRSVDDTLDICQTVFLKAYRKLDTFAGRSSIGARYFFLTNQDSWRGRPHCLLNARHGGLRVFRAGDARRVGG